MATTPKYQKVGYENSLEFDPASGIIKYGNYEFFADQVGVKPIVQDFNFDTYKKSIISSGQLYGPAPTDDVLRQQFVTAVKNGDLSKAPATAADALGGRPPASEMYNIGTHHESPSMASAIYGLQGRPNTNNGSFGHVEQVDANTYRATAYSIPSDIEFVNRLNAQAAQLATAAGQGQVTDPEAAKRSAAGNARLGKPNYSRASTILAGEQSPLGGTKTTLGA